MDFYLFPNLKTNFCGRNFGSNEGVTDAADKYLRDQKEGFYFEGISKWNSIRESVSRQRDIILRNNGTISALGRSQSTGTESFFIVSHIFLSLE